MSLFAERLYEELARQHEGGASGAERRQARDETRRPRVFVSYANRDHVSAHNLSRLLASYSQPVALTPASDIDVVSWGAVGSSVVPALRTLPTWRSWWRRWAPVAGLAVLVLLVFAAAAGLVPLASRRPDLVAGLGLALALLSLALPPAMKALWRHARGRP